MILSDFLSRQKHDASNPHEIIPTSFNMHSLLQYQIIREIFNTEAISGKI